MRNTLPSCIANGLQRQYSAVTAAGIVFAMLKRSWDENRELRAEYERQYGSSSDMKIGRNEVYMDKLFNDLDEILVDTQSNITEVWKHALTEHSDSVQDEVGQLFQTLFGVPIPTQHQTRQADGPFGFSLDDIVEADPDNTIQTLIDVAETAQAHASEHVTPNTLAAVEAWNQAAQAWKGVTEAALFLKRDKTSAGFYRANYQFCKDRANEARVNADTLGTQPMGDMPRDIDPRTTNDI